MLSGREDILEERYAIEFCFKLGKNATETYGMLQTAFRPSFMNRAWVFEWHKRFKEGRESVRDNERCGRSKKVNTLAKRLGLGLGLLCWGFKGVQEEIPKDEASTLQIGSVAFPPGQCTSPQHHPCHRLFDSWRRNSNNKYRAISLMSRVFATGPGDWGSIPSWVIPKTQKMVLDTTLLNTQYYKVRIKGKVEQSREWSNALPYTLV